MTRATAKDIQRMKAKGLTVSEVPTYHHFRYLVGVDPGTHVGLSLWDRQEKKLFVVATMGIIDAQTWFRMILQEEAGKSLFVRMEDARTWKTYKTGDNRKERWQGAGSIRRDTKIWIEFFKVYAIPYELVPLGGKKTKMNAELFQKVTGWKERTNNHERDSALLVFNL